MLLEDLKNKTFTSEAEEALWWEANEDGLAEEFERAVVAGTLGIGTVAKRFERGSATNEKGFVPLPLSEDLRERYMSVYEQTNRAISSIRDPELLFVLNRVSNAAAEVINSDNAYRIEADAATFLELQKKLRHSKDDLGNLHTQIVSAANFSAFSDIALSIMRIIAPLQAA